MLRPIGRQVIAAVIVDMVLKPTGDDVGTLILMAGIVLVIAGASFLGARERAAEHGV